MQLPVKPVIFFFRFTGFTGQFRGMPACHLSHPIFQNHGNTISDQFCTGFKGIPGLVKYRQDRPPFRKQVGFLSPGMPHDL